MLILEKNRGAIVNINITPTRRDSQIYILEIRIAFGGINPAVKAIREIKMPIEATIQIPTLPPGILNALLTFLFLTS